MSLSICPPHVSPIPQADTVEWEQTDRRPRDHVGRFHVARQREGQPVAAAGWRVTTPNQQTAERLPLLLGGTVRRCLVDGQEQAEVLTSRETVPVLLRVEDISWGFRLRGSRETFHACDGRVFTEPPSRQGQRCGCAPAWTERRSAARAGRGPMPDGAVMFRLAQVPDVGVFLLKSTSWEFTESLSEISHAMCRGPGFNQFSLQLKRIDFMTVSGVSVSYRRPILSL